MKGRFLIAVSAAAGTLALLPGLGSAGPPPNPVTVQDSEFDPANSSQLVASSTVWDWADPMFNPHNVREDHKLFRSGNPTTDTETSYSVKISAGTFHYYCEEHGSKTGGMDGVVEVTPEVDGTATNHLIPVRWSDDTATGNQFDLKWRGPGSGGRYRTWLKNTSLFAASFGAGDNPVDVQPGRIYKIKARSELASNTERRSGFSPPLEIAAAP